MTSAVPYEPDDFDNNPFAEQSVILPQDHPSETPVAASVVAPASTQPFGGPENLTNNMPGAFQSSGPLFGQQPAGGVGGAGGAAGAGDYNGAGDADDADVSNGAEGDGSQGKKPFHDYPTEQDLRRYIPERLNKGQFGLKMKVLEVESNGSGSNAQRNPIIRFEASVKNIPGFRRQAYKEVRRTYKELENFYKYLIYNNIEVFVPALPAVTPSYTAMSPEYIDSVSRNVQNWFNRVCSNPILIRNQEFVLLFEQNDFSYTPSKTKPSNKSVMATGLKRKTLKQLQPPYDASQVLAEYRPMIKAVHVDAEKLVDRLDKLVRLQKQSSDSDSEFHAKMAEVAPPVQRRDRDSDVAKIWIKSEKIMQIFNEMSLVGNVALNSLLSECFSQIADDCYNIKEALTNRHLLMRELVNAEENTRRRQAKISQLKAKSTIDPVKIDDAIRALELANNYQKEVRYEVKRTTYEMIIESKQYTEYLTELLKRTFKQVAQTQIQRERKKLHLLETNKIISPQESLGRLGREGQQFVTTTPSSSSAESSPTKQRQYLPRQNQQENWHNNSGSGRPESVVSNGSDSWNSRPKKDYDDPLSGASAFTEEEISNVDAKSAVSFLAGSSF